MSKAILIVDIDNGIDLSAVEIEYFVYDISIHDIPFGKKIIKAGGLYNPKPLPPKKEEIDIMETITGTYGKNTIILEKVIEKARQQGFNQCLDEILGGII